MSGYHRYWLRKRLWQTIGLFQKSSLVRWLLAPFVWMLWLRAAIGRRMTLTIRARIDRFVRPRRLARDFLLGLPSVLILLAFAAATAMGHLQQRDAAQRYWVRGEQELQAGDPHTAQIYLQKAILSDRADRRAIVFALARAYQRTEDFDRSHALMESLAAVGTAGYPPAHRYRALRMADEIIKTKQVDDLEAWRWHLSHADQADSAELQKCWATYYLLRNDLKNAREHISRAAEQEPALWLKVAELDVRLNDRKATVQTLKTARQRLEPFFLDDPADDKRRLLYLTSLLNSGELAEAQRLLTERLQESDNPSFRRLLAVVCVKRFDIETQDPQTSADAVKLLHTALDCDPSFRPALARLVGFARSTPESVPETRAILQQLTSSGNASAMAHLTLGSLEWIAGNVDRAEDNMRQAIALDQHLPVVANNLAFLMAQSEEGDLKAALAFAEQAVEAEPDNAEYRDTRGLILAKLGRLPEAADDYQQALKTISDSAPLRQKLADLYDRLGDAERAAEYRDASPAAPSAPTGLRFQL